MPPQYPKMKTMLKLTDCNDSNSIYLFTYQIIRVARALPVLTTVLTATGCIEIDFHAKV